MRKLFLFILILPIILAGAYAGLVLSQDNSTTNIVKLVGPGDNPQLCFARAKENFAKIKSALTSIADAMLADENLMEVWYYPPPTPEVWVEEKSGMNRESTPEESKHFEQYFKSFNNNYYSPLILDRRGDNIQARLFAQCGYSPFEWFRLQLKIFDQNMNTTKPVAYTFLTYHQTDVVLSMDCPNNIPPLNPNFGCEAKMSNNWVWSVEWWDFESLESM